VLRLLRRLLILALAGVALFVLVPSAGRALPPAGAGEAPDVRGVIHVHTVRSDGTGSIDSVTAAAARAGLDFVIVTDHGDGTRPPDAPEYRNGVLYVDALEVSTNDGHLLALGLPQAPYPLRGDARDVVEDVTRLGGFSIAAHPGSAKSELQWTDWNSQVNGLEWLNGDSEWRDERWWTLAQTLLAYPFRPSQALALLLDRPSAVLDRWDTLTQQRQVVAIAGSDAHSRVGVRSVGEPYDGGGSLHFPSYDAVFREFTVSVPELRLTNDATADARSLIGAIRAGHVYSTIDALGGPTHFRFAAEGPSGMARMGDTMPIDGAPVMRVYVQAPVDARITLRRNGLPVATGGGATLEYRAPPEIAVYRVEVALPRAPGVPPVPWIVSNPIYVGRRPDSVPTLPSALESLTLYNGGPARDWTIEKSAASDAALNVVQTLGASQVLLRFALSGAPSDHPYAAFVMPATSGIAGHDRLVFTAHADRPMRVAVQLRSAGGINGQRWQRSIYLDQTPRKLELGLHDFRPVETEPAIADLASVQSVLFVVDAVNTRIGSNGQIWLGDIRYTR
jgi:hypothetical protein